MATMPQEERPVSTFEVLGMMVAIGMSSDYRNWSLSEVGDNLVPALLAEQYKIYFDENGKPLAFLTWALVDNECHEALLCHGRNPPPDRWTSGENLWFIDIVAPFGGTLHIIRDIQRNHFPHVHAHSIKRNQDGSIKRVKVWRNGLVRRS
ncbi:toxin-activating lysine-acyltransferase [Ensifer adhaerens]|uniref:toxin-activating lysine-acyltransferase n=1 Tax=Ensifer adhaerens TaxID=106592 RepID=UPI001EED7836|nr:toxin-activating lysine-acyltransferase [Ensifer adhaerens]